MQFAVFGQKFEIVSESHWFSYKFFILSGDIALNACWYTYALDSNPSPTKIIWIYNKYYKQFHEELSQTGIDIEFSPNFDYEGILKRIEMESDSNYFLLIIDDILQISDELDLIFTRWLIYWLIDWLIYLLIDLFIDWFTHLLIYHFLLFIHLRSKRDANNLKFSCIGLLTYKMFNLKTVKNLIDSFLTRRQELQWRNWLARRTYKQCLQR